MSYNDSRAGNATSECGQCGIRDDMRIVCLITVSELSQRISKQEIVAQKRLVSEGRASFSVNLLIFNSFINKIYFINDQLRVFVVLYTNSDTKTKSTTLCIILSVTEDCWCDLSDVTIMNLLCRYSTYVREK